MDTTAMEPTPKMADMGGQLKMSDAMDILDEFGIEKADYPLVMAALEMVYSGKPEPEPPGESETDDSSEQQALSDVFRRS